VTRSDTGIAIPDGRPGELEALGAELAAMSGALEAASIRLRALPATLDGWSGPASVSFAETAFAQADATAVAGEAFALAREAVRAYARELREARHDAREAIEQARDADARMRAAESAIEDARLRLAAALAHDAAAAATLVGDAGAVAAAEADLRAAMRRRDEAEDDLERARRRGRRAEESARDAETKVVGAYSAILAMVPHVPALGAPAQGRSGGPAAVSIPGADRFGQVDFAVALTGGALTGIGARELHRAAVRAERRYRSYRPWRGLAMTPDDEIGVSGSRANAGRAAQTARGARLNAFRTLGPATVVVEPLSAYRQFKGNEASGMNATENVVRTGAASAGALAVGFAGGAACAATGVGVLVAGACGAAGAMLGSFGGDKLGQGLHWAGDQAYTHALDPAWEATGGALLDELGIGG
jgi:hypothetical protein